MVFILKEHKAIESPNVTCFKCLKEDNKLHSIKIPEMGYGSVFDGWSTTIQLCDECYKTTNLEWWKFKEVPLGDDFYEYEYDSEIYNFLKNLPLLGQELVFNRFCNGWNSDFCEPQDFIDYELGILSHEKCKEYGWYSHQEIQAYKEKFPTCNHPVNVIWSDDSVGCYCPYGANGDEDQEASLNISTNCYQCSKYIGRYEPIKQMSNDDYDEYASYVVGKDNYLTFREKYEKVVEKIKGCD